MAHYAKKLVTVGVLALFACLPGALQSQAKSSGNPDVDPSRVDLFGGYSYWYPYQMDIDKVKFKPIQTGAVASISVWMNHWLGLQAEGAMHPHGPNDCFASAQGGVVVRRTFGHWVPMAHALGGGVKMGGPVLNPCTWGYGGTAGVGLDYVLHGWGEHVAIRVFQADAQYNYVDFGPLILPGRYSGGIGKGFSIRGSAGVVFRFGQSSDRQQAQLACTANPGTIFPGDPIQVSTTTLNIDIRRDAAYAWNTNGGRIEGKGDTVTIHTDGLAPGEYKVTGAVQQGRGSMGHATCDTSFTVKIYEPPTVTCTANPTSLQLNQGSTITAVGTSPQNRALKYTFATSAGQLTSDGSTAQLNAQGLPPGDVNVTCTATDDLGKAVSSTATLNISAPVAPPAPTQRPLCTVAFNNDLRRPARVDNEAKGCLDDIALAMQRESDATLVIVGEHGDDEGSPLAAERAMNVKTYLTREKGIEAARIQVRMGAPLGHTVEDILVPNGATFLMDGTEVVDEGSVRHTSQPYGTMQGPAVHSMTGQRSTRRRTRRTTTHHSAHKRSKRAAAEGPIGSGEVVPPYVPLDSSGSSR